MSRKTRKLIWSAPLVAVFAVAGALALFVALAPGGVLAHDVTAAPTDLKAQADGSRAIILTWKAPAGEMPTGYRIDVSENRRVWKSLMPDTGNADLSHRHDTELSAGYIRHYRVFALNAHGASPVSNVARGKTTAATKPTPVQNLTATANGQDEIVLGWNAPSNDGGTDITGYNVEVFDADDDTWVAPPDGQGIKAITYMDDDLDPGTSKSYRVIAMTGATAPNDISDPSNTVTATTNSAGLPDPPTDLTIALGNGGVMNLYWYGPTDDGGIAVSGYRIEVSDDENDLPSTKAPQTTTAADSPISSDAQLPDVFRLSVDTGANNVTQKTFTEASGFTGTYHFRVYTETGDDGATRRTSLLYAKGEATPEPDPTVPAAPNVTASSGLDGKIELTVDETGVTDAGDIRYRFDVSDDGGTNWTSLEDDTTFTVIRGSARRFRQGGLKPDLTRVYRVFAIHNETDMISEASSLVTGMTKVTTNPGVVKGLKAEAVSATQINLVWTMPDDNGGQPITSYRIEVALDGTNNGTPDGIPDEWPMPMDGDMATDNDNVRMSTSTSYSDIKDLSVNMTRFYRVIAITKGEATRTGAASTFVSATTRSANAPSMPGGLTSEAAKDAEGLVTGVLLLWNAPDDPDGDVVTHYVVDRSIDGGVTWQKPADNEFTSADTNYNDPNAPAADETSRTYRVAAKNAAGQSVWSMIDYPQTLPGHTHESVVMELTVPSLPDPTVETVGGVKIISVLWNSGEGEERQIVQLLTEDRMFVDVQTVGPDAITADFKGPDSDGDGVADGVAPGTYRVQIVARGTGTDFRNSGTVLVTVE